MHPLVEIQSDLKSAKPGQKVIAVFDLDSTLFDVSPRIQKILHEFAEENKELFPNEAAVISQIKVDHRVWGIKNTLESHGLKSDDEKVLNRVREYWFQKFFSNDYLDLDRPYEGAVEFVKQIKNEGAEIRYLTGRDDHRMGRGTLESLRAWQFPLSENLSELALKPDQKMVDHEFKRDWFLALQKADLENPPILWFFENEPLNIEVIRKVPSLNSIKIVYFDSTHSGRAKAPLDLRTISSFATHKDAKMRE